MQEHQRICFISFYFAPMIGGAETQSERQARQLQALGNEVKVVTLRADRRWKRREVLDGLPVIRVGGIHKSNGQLRVGRLGYLPCSIAMFLMLWRLRHEYDVIHVFQVTPLAAAAALIGKLTNTPVVISIQSAGPGEEESKRLEHGGRLMVDTLTDIDTDFLNLEAQEMVTGDITYLPRAVLGGNIIVHFLRKAKVCFHVNSKRNYAYVTSKGFRAEQIVRIPHGVDTEKYRPPADPVIHHQPGQANSERVILCVARLDYAKGVDVLLHAWARMMKARSASGAIHLGAINRATAPAGLTPTPRLFLVGDGNLRPQLERMVAELDIADSVEFMGMRRDIPGLLQQAWGFVCPSRWESLPNALLEAMASGLPCVATRVSGTEDIIIDGKNGLMVEPDDSIEMAQALQRILEDGNLAQQLGKMARAAIIPDYQLTTVVKRFTELYRYLITCHKHGKNWIEGPVPWRPQEQQGTQIPQGEDKQIDLRIYIAISTFHPLVGGAEKQALLQARSLRERGHQATIITFHHEKRWQVCEMIEGVPVVRVAGRLLGEREKYPRVLQKVVYLLAMVVMGRTLWRHRRRYDLLHVYQLNLLALPAALVCRLTGKPFVVAVRSALLPGEKQISDPIIPLLQVDKTTRIIHDLADLERFGRPIVRCTRFLLSCEQVMIVVLSSRMREYMAAHDFNLPNIQLIPNGVDTRRFQVMQATCAARGGNYAGNLLEDHSQTVVCVSRLSYEKGVDVLLQAWQLVYKEVSQAKLVIVGDGPLEAQLVEMVEALGIAESVEFMGMQDDVAAQLHRSSIAVLPSRHEGMPNAVLEAMACGLPCVATRVSGSEDIIEQGINGLLVEIEDYRNMGQALLALLRDAALTRKLGYAARASIEQRYTLEHVIDSYIKLYYKLIGMR